MQPYLPLTQIYDRVRKLAPTEVYGKSVEGRELLVATLPGDGPVITVTAGIHGLEYIGVYVALKILEAGPLPGAQLKVFPVLNPDGYERTWRCAGDAPVRALRKNANSVDLNRNFPLPYGARPSRIPFTGSPHPDSPTYRGRFALCEPESAALAAALRQAPPHASANLHSFMGTLVCARVWHPSDWRNYTALVQAFRAHQSGWLGYRRLSSPIDVFTGELEDWQHHILRCWAVCVECFSLRQSFGQHLRAPTNFWRFNPRDPSKIASADAIATRGMLLRALQLPRPPARVGATTGRFVPTHSEDITGTSA